MGIPLGLQVILPMLGGALGPNKGPVPHKFPHSLLKFVNGENLLRKILLLIIENFYEGSTGIDHINIYYLINNITLIPIEFESLNTQEDRLS